MKPLKDFFKKFTFTPLNILKLAGLGFVAVFLLAIVLSIVSVFASSLRGEFGMLRAGIYGGGIGGGASYDMGVAKYEPATYPAYDQVDEDHPALPVRNVASVVPFPPVPFPGSSTGDQAEAFEVTEYTATYESANKKETCGAIAALKSRSAVVFESANEYDRGCNYSFKVRHASVPEILAILKRLNPRDLSETTYTIKAQIDDFTSETEILEKKRASLDTTLEEAIAAYDAIQRVATEGQDAEALARIIDSKIQLIERLSRERISINEQLDRYARQKSDALDRLEYTHFGVTVMEVKYFDRAQLWDSWKGSMRGTVHEINGILQDITLGFAALLFLALQYVLYLILFVVIVKYVWKLVRFIWLR